MQQTSRRNAATLSKITFHLIIYSNENQIIWILYMFMDAVRAEKEALHTADL